MGGLGQFNCSVVINWNVYSIPALKKIELFASHQLEVLRKFDMIFKINSVVCETYKFALISHAAPQVSLSIPPKYKEDRPIIFKGRGQNQNNCTNLFRVTQ